MTVGQTEFIEALLNPDLAIPEGLVDPMGRPAGKRFDVYRNNVIVSLIDAMQTAFPVIHKLVGDAFFKAMAGVYVRAHPPTSPLLMFYGKELPVFLETFEHTQKLAYLPDVARLELARRDSYHAKDSAAIDPEALASIAPDALMGASFTLSPSMCVLSSPYPILSLWNMNMIADAPKPQAGAEIVLLTRPELDVEMQMIDEPTHVFLSTLATNSLDDAYEAALSIQDDFDLPKVIGLILDQKIVTEINI